MSSMTLTRSSSASRCAQSTASPSPTSTTPSPCTCTSHGTTRPPWSSSRPRTRTYLPSTLTPSSTPSPTATPLWCRSLSCWRRRRRRRTLCCLSLLSLSSAELPSTLTTQPTVRQSLAWLHGCVHVHGRKPWTINLSVFMTPHWKVLQS